MSLRKRSILALAATCFLVLLSFIPIGVSYASSTSSTQYPNFRGIYEFSGLNTSTDATNPAIAGRDLTFYWAQIEPTKGQYNWSVIDQAMKPWVDNGKGVMLRVSTAGWKEWDPGADSAHGTPQWVYDLGVKSVTELDGSVLPEYWNPIFLQNYSDFIQAFANHYDGNPNVAAIQMGIGVGGETKVDSYKTNKNMLQLWQTIGYTDQLWWGAVQQMITSYSSSFHQTPTVVMPDASFIGGTSGYNEGLVTSYAVSKNVWLQANDLGASNVNKSSDWNKVPHLEEQLNYTAKTGDTLLADLQNGLKLGANYILVFTNDIDISSNQSALQQIAALANTPTPTPTATNTPVTTPTDTPTPAPTDTPTPTVTATSTPVPTSYRYSFEDGTLDGWGDNHAYSLANSTTYAFDGAHSLKTVVKSPNSGDYASVSISNTASGSPAMPAIGQSVTAEVYVPSGAPAVKAVVFVKDNTGTKYYTSYDQVSDLATGKWTQLQFTVPSTVSGGVTEYGVRFQFSASSSNDLNAYIDAVNW